MLEDHTAKAKIIISSSIELRRSLMQMKELKQPRKNQRSTRGSESKKMRRHGNRSEMNELAIGGTSLAPQLQPSRRNRRR
jgi:uncharacterized protein with von Willebrand factor type A (vWA) domain